MLDPFLSFTASTLTIKPHNERHSPAICFLNRNQGSKYLQHRRQASTLSDGSEARFDLELVLLVCNPSTVYRREAQLPGFQFNIQIQIEFSHPVGNSDCHSPIKHILFQVVPYSERTSIPQVPLRMHQLAR